MGDDDAAALRARAVLRLSDEGAPPEEVAHHLLLLPELTAPWMTTALGDAAADAMSRAAPEAAAGYLRKALEAEPDSLPLRLHLAQCVSETDPAEAVALLGPALEAPLDVRARTAVALQFAGVCPSAQESPAAVRVLAGVGEELDAVLGPGPGPADLELRTHVHAALLMTGADEKSTIDFAREQAARKPAPPGDTPAQRQVLATHALLGVLGSGTAQECTQTARRALRFSDVSVEQPSLFAAAFALGLTDEVDEALGALDRLLRECRRSSAVWSHVRTLAVRAFVLHGVGALPDALADARAAVDLAGDARWGHASTMPHIALAMVLTDLGEPHRAQEVLDGIKRPALDRFVLEYPWYLLVRARILFCLDDVPGSVDLLRACGRALQEAGVVNPVFLPWWVDAAGMLMDLGRPREAREVAALGAETARRWSTPRARALAVLARGMTTPGPQGLALLKEAVGLFTESPARSEHARAEFLVGRALLTEGDRLSARDHLREAAGLAQRCGLLTLGELSRTLLLQAGGRMRKMSASPRDMLTGMESKVADLAAAGRSNRSIAESLFVSVRTVETHLTSTYRKLGITRRAELTAVLRARERFVRQLPPRPGHQRV